MIEYCLGFVLSPNYEVVLLRKKVRTMHIGLWNGVGGKLDGEPAIQAMKRECLEESGIEVTNWKLVGYLRGDSKEDWRVFVYAALDPLLGLHVVDLPSFATDDKPYVVPLHALDDFNLAPHVRGLVGFSIDRLRNNNGPIVTIQETYL